MAAFNFNSPVLAPIDAVALIIILLALLAPLLAPPWRHEPDVAEGGAAELEADDGSEGDGLEGETAIPEQDTVPLFFPAQAPALGPASPAEMLAAGMSVMALIEARSGDDPPRETPQDTQQETQETPQEDRPVAPERLRIPTGFGPQQIAYLHLLRERWYGHAEHE